MSISKMIGEKRRWREYKARIRLLPPAHRITVEALERYLTYRGAITKGDIMLSMLGDLAELFEQSAALGTPVREIVGEDPVEFAEVFLRNYSEGEWIDKERERLVKAIDRVTAADASSPQRTA